MDILQVVSLILGGGGVGFLFTYLIKNRQVDQSQFEALIARWEKDNERLRQREVNNSEEITKLREEVSSLKSKLALLESAHFDLPLPQWIKDTDGKMLSVNIEYERTFLIPLGLKNSDYIGSTDKEIWGRITAQHFSVADKKVLRTRKPLHVVEDIPDGSGNLVKYLVFKYPIFSGSVLIGVGGVALKEEHAAKQLLI